MKNEKCDDCGITIKWSVASFSLKVFGRYLCIPCQKRERSRKYPKKMADFLNKQI